MLNVEKVESPPNMPVVKKSFARGVMKAACANQ